MKAELEKIQQAVAQALTASNLFAQCAIYMQGRDDAEAKRTDAPSITVSAPLPLKAAKKAQSAAFEEVEIGVEIRAAKFQGERGGSIVAIAENVCRCVHNQRVSQRKNCGRILMAQNRPFEFAESAQSKSITVKFNIQGVCL